MDHLIKTPSVRIIELRNYFRGSVLIPKTWMGLSWGLAMQVIKWDLWLMHDENMQNFFKF